MKGGGFPMPVAPGHKNEPVDSLDIIQRAQCYPPVRTGDPVPGLRSRHALLHGRTMSPGFSAYGICRFLVWRWVDLADLRETVVDGQCELAYGRVTRCL